MLVFIYYVYKVVSPSWFDWMNYRVIPSIFGSMDQTSRPQLQETYKRFWKTIWFMSFGIQFEVACEEISLVCKRNLWQIKHVYASAESKSWYRIYILFNKEYGGIMLISQMFPRAFGFFPRIFKTQPALGNIRWSLIFWQLNINNHVQIITFFQILLAFKVM